MIGETSKSETAAMFVEDQLAGVVRPRCVISSRMRASSEVSTILRSRRIPKLRKFHTLIFATLPDLSSS
jgi:hypothetical protein